MQEVKNVQRKKKGNLYRNFVQLVAVGSVTGVFAGAIVTLFTLLVHEGEALSQDAYAYIRHNPAFIPVLLAVLFLSAFILSVLMQCSTVVRGGGVPQAEGAARGIVPLKWWRDLTLMFAGTLVGVFSGLSVGAEGPSILIGACTGDGVSRTLRRDQMIRKYQITGGSCAGLAVAFNAPLMGMAFAFEEAHKRFSPEVFICAFSSVIFAVLTRVAIYATLGLEASTSFSRFAFEELPIFDYLFVVPSGIVCGLLGVLFYKLSFLSRKLFRKLRARKEKYTLFLRVTVAVLIGGLLSLLAAEVMGGGHALIESLGTKGGTEGAEVASVFGLPIVLTLLVVLIAKTLATTVNMGAGIPCGIFIPMLAIGGCIGGMLGRGWIALGMDKAHYDLIVMICMASFFTTVVKAPITAIIMTCELTGSFAPLLPVIIAVCIGYMIGELFRTDGIYEELLEIYEQESGAHEREVTEAFTMAVGFRSLADKREVKDILWPSGARVKELRRGEEVILPDGETKLLSGDILTIVCKTKDPAAVKEELEHILS